MNTSGMISKYIVKKIEHKLHLSYFAGVPYKKTTIFILRDSKHNYNFDVIEQFQNAYFQIIDISDVTPRILNDKDSYLMCSGTHYGFHSCVLKLRASSPVTDIGWPCHFQHYAFYTQAPSAIQPWWNTVDDLETTFIIDDELDDDDDKIDTDE